MDTTRELLERVATEARSEPELNTSPSILLRPRRVCTRDVTKLADLSDEAVTL